MMTDTHIRPDGMVYIMTNAAGKNEIAAFKRRHDGRLTFAGFYATNGSGTGTTEVSRATPNDGIDPLASQGSLILSPDGGQLFAVNAGSGTISSFLVDPDGRLKLADVVPSGGKQPNALTYNGGLLYVTNVGSAVNGFRSNVTGFMADRHGRLHMIPRSARSLSTQDAQPSSVLFSPDGSFLVVSELTTNRISAFNVRHDGTISRVTSTPSSGAGPFGSVFITPGFFLVAEAGANALTSYGLMRSASLRTLSGSVQNGQSATCWVAALRDGRYAYTSNAASGTISIYRVQKNGRLRMIRSVSSVRRPMSSTPIDNGISPDGHNLYVLNGNSGMISVFHIDAGGQLLHMQTVGAVGIPKLGTQGLAVR